MSWVASIREQTATNGHENGRREVLDVHMTTHVEPAASLPTALCSVVWSGGHSYVLEVPDKLGRSCRWIGLGDYGRPLALSPADLQARGWTLRPS